ncbi:MAG: hypothetical protein ACI4AK_06970 [Lepagella sp.]
MKSYLNLSVFDDAELEMIITAASLLSEILRKPQSFHSKCEMYEKFDEWRTIVNLQCSAYNELKHRSQKP